MKKIFIFAVTLMSMFALGCEKDYNPSSTTRADFQQSYPNAVDVEWEREHGHIVAEFKLPGVSNECEAWFTKDGTWVLTTFDIKKSELPQAVLNAFESEYGAMTPIDDVKYVTRSNGDDIYFIEIENIVDNQLVDLFLDYSPDGKLLRTWIEVEYYENIYYYL